MAYSEELADRIRDVLADREVEEMKMFGGIAFMIDGNMACGVIGEDLCARMGPAAAEHVGEPNVREMDFTGRRMSNFVLVEPPGVKAERDLELWVRRCVDFADSLPAR